MYHENQRCAGQVQHLQNVSLAVELHRFVAMKASEWRYSQDDGMYGAGFIDAMKLVDRWLGERVPDLSRCDNPPE